METAEASGNVKLQQTMRNLWERAAYLRNGVEDRRAEPLLDLLAQTPCSSASC